MAPAESLFEIWGKRYCNVYARLNHPGPLQWLVGAMEQKARLGMWQYCLAEAPEDVSGRGGRISGRIVDRSQYSRIITDGVTVRKAD